MGGEENETRIEHDARVSPPSIPTVEEAREAADARKQAALDRAATKRRQASSATGDLHDSGGPEVKALEQIRKELHEVNDHLAMIRRIMVWVWIIGPCIAGLILLIIWISQMNDSSSTPYGLGVLMLLP